MTTWHGRVGPCTAVLGRGRALLGGLYAPAPRSESWASPGHADLIPEAAVEVEVVALRLALAVVADVGV